MAEESLLKPGWEIEGISTARPFFSSIGILLPLPVYFCFEGTSIEPDVWALLQKNSASPHLQVPTGTLWPKPRVIHVLATAEFVSNLAAIADSHAEPEICDHLHAYKDSKLLLQWHDAFDLPILLDVSIPEEFVQNFCRAAGATYTRCSSHTTGK